jgi:hypothetical protein
MDTFDAKKPQSKISWLGGEGGERYKGTSTTNFSNFY